MSPVEHSQAVLGALQEQRAELTAATGVRFDRDCTVYTLAVVAGVDYATASYALALYGKRRPREGTYHMEFTQALRALGFSCKLHGPLLSDLMERARTTVTAERRLRKIARHRRFILGTRTHYAAFDGTAVIDWSQGRRLHLRSIFEVTPL